MNARRTKHTGRIEVKPALKHIAGLKAAWASAYQAACKRDGIDPPAAFCAFSDDNPFVPFVNAAHRQYAEALQQYAAGGYIGLTLSQG